MKRGCLVMLPLAMALPAAAWANTDAMKGYWQRGDAKATVRVAPCGNDMCAYNTWVNDPSGSEKVGDKLVMSLQPADKGLKGEAFDPQRNLTYSMAVQVQGTTMTTKGCIMLGLLCNSMGWTKLPAPQ